jgi:hypothetical protein
VLNALPIIFSNAIKITMNITEAIKIVKKYNKWRRGDERLKQPDPKTIGIAIDVLITYAEQHKDIINEFAKKTAFKNCK